MYTVILLFLTQTLVFILSKYLMIIVTLSKVKGIFYINICLKWLKWLKDYEEY